MVRNIPVRYTQDSNHGHGSAKARPGSSEVIQKQLAVQEMLLKEWPNGGNYDFLLLGCIWDPPRSSIKPSALKTLPLAGTCQFASRRSAARPSKCCLQAMFLKMWASTPMLFGFKHPLYLCRRV